MTGRRPLAPWGVTLALLLALVPSPVAATPDEEAEPYASPVADYLQEPRWERGYQTSQVGSFMNPQGQLPDWRHIESSQRHFNLKLEGFSGGYGYFFGDHSLAQATTSATATEATDGPDIELSTQSLPLGEASLYPSPGSGQIAAARPEDGTPLSSGRPVHLVADKVTMTEESIIAEGNAAVDVMGARMLCNYLVLDKTTGRLTASGECVVYWNNNFIASDWLTYDPNRKVAVMHNVTGQGHNFSSADNEMDNDIFFWSDTLHWTPEKMTLSDATFTTCDKNTDDLDYKFTSQLVEIFPQDKLIASNTGIYLKGTKLYTMPTLNIPLDNKRRARKTIIPQIGSNSVDGWFVRTTFDYVFDNNNYGELLLDYYSKTGIGTGLHHYYTLGPKGEGDFYYYRLNGDKISSRYDLSSNITYRFDDQTKVSWEFSSNKSETPGFTNEGRVNSLFNFSHKTDTQDLRFSHNYNTKGSENRNTTWRMYYDLQLTPELSTMWKAELSTIATSASIAQRFYYRGGLRHTSELFDSELYMENTTGDTNYSLNRNPEFTLRSHPIFVGDVPLLASASFGYVTESPSMYSTNRYDLRLQIPDQSFEYDSGRFLMGAGLRQLFYGNGQSMYTLAARLGWLQELGEIGTIRFDYNWLSPRGETPLQYDLTNGYENITGGIEFFKDDVFNLAVVGGYNLRTDRFQNITPRIQFRPQKDWLIGVGSAYDPHSHTWRNLDANLRLKLTKELAVSHWSVYDFVNNRFTYQDYQLDYEAHDWITSLVYRSVQNELYFQFSLKAFPQPAVTIGPNPAQALIPKNRRNAFVH